MNNKKEKIDETKLHIRPFEGPDYEAVIALWESAGIPCKPHGRDTREKILKEVTNPGTLFLVAMYDGVISGTVLATHDGRKGWINRLSVAPSLQRRGLASRLLVKAMEHLDGCGMEITACLVEADNLQSREFFRHQNFVEHTDIIYFSKRKHADV